MQKDGWDRHDPTRGCLYDHGPGLEHLVGQFGIKVDRTAQLRRLSRDLLNRALAPSFSQLCRSETQVGKDGVPHSWISVTKRRHVGLVLTGRDTTTDRPLVLSSCIARMTCKPLGLVQ